MSGTAVSRTMPDDESLSDNLVGMGSFLIDPGGAARRIFHRWFWIGPWVLMAVVASVGSYLTLPIIQHVLEIAPVPPGADPAAMQKGAEIGMKLGRIGMYASPATTLLLFAVQAAILFGMTSILSVRAKYMHLLNLVAGCSLIQALAAIASVVIVRTKADISSMAELRPALGLDLLLPEGSNKMLVAFVGYFSIFEIWWVVMVTLVLSEAFGIPKTKALLVVSPIILISLALRLTGAAFARA